MFSRRSSKLTWILFCSFLVVFTWNDANADDQFLCCMRGWKKFRDVTVCDAPCCPGYIQKVSYPKIIGPLTYCDETYETKILKKLRRRRKLNTIVRVGRSVW
ncbi:uncharacterized protein LOC141909277 [Tubulanus polymorphus]|uniref:uncharacterized protein LOC141909277 n=1 Tax=Tubulanus polymorphus TaxID=672921 RepID=UPI003DA5846F